MRSCSRIRSAIRAAPAAPATCSESTTSSSPPKRATVSSARSAEATRSAARWSTSSPPAWPKRSLTALKPSKSRNSTASGACSRCSRRIAWSSRSKNRTRLGSPVSGSWSAWWSSSSSARLRTTNSPTCTPERLRERREVVVELRAARRSSSSRPIVSAPLTTGTTMPGSDAVGGCAGALPGGDSATHASAARRPSSCSHSAPALPVELAHHGLAPAPAAPRVSGAPPAMIRATPCRAERRRSASRCSVTSRSSARHVLGPALGVVEEQRPQRAPADLAARPHVALLGVPLRQLARDHPPQRLGGRGHVVGMGDVGRRRRSSSSPPGARGTRPSPRWRA